MSVFDFGALCGDANLAAYLPREILRPKKIGELLGMDIWEDPFLPEGAWGIVGYHERTP